MPSVPPHTYPGVYIQELPGGVRTITGVATSIAAFIGRAARGPVNEPTMINSFADFENIFGGLWSQSALGQMVRDFYLNGGSQAIIVRLYHADAPAPAPASGTGKGAESGTANTPSTPPKTTATLNADTLPLAASNPGSWGNYLRARIESVNVQGIGARYGLNDTDLFTLTVTDTRTNTTEIFRNVSFQPGSQQVDKVLAMQSSLVRVPAGTVLPGVPPKAHGAPAKGKSIWEDDAASSGVQSKDAATDGSALTSDDFIGNGTASNKTGLYALERVDLFNLLALAPYTPGNDVDAGVIAEAAAYCERRRAILLVDPPGTWNNKDQARAGLSSLGTSSKNAVLYYPRLRRADSLDDFVPSGAIAGVIARTDVTRGVWKAPAGLDATLTGVSRLSVSLTDAEIGELNQLGINSLRTMPAAGPVVWGARTLQGDDRLESEWKYLSVRRLALYIEESLYEGTKWVVFEPNSETLWSQIRLNLGTFMRGLFRQGAFQGQTPQDAYFVQCDSTTTAQADIDQGIVNIVVGFAPLKPAEFVILNIQQMAGQLTA
ncbi:MAG TPA: phage tail sheath subtilisin-like domain-containing protein [Ktedonobacteraceae bacterium]|nr:phage tail sheath subtilisin-like domain-containing protein [Ktedonobacteraceae bacterium]